MSGEGSEWTNYGLVVGGDGDGRLVISHGASASSAIGFIGGSYEFLGGGAGYVTVTGTSAQDPTIRSKWEVNELYIGYNGWAELNIEHSALISSDTSYVGYDANGFVQVRGLGSVWENSGGLHIGQYGYGEVDVLDGGRVQYGYGGIGESYGGAGVLFIKGHQDGQRSEVVRTSNSILFIGEEGAGNLTIDEGGA